MAGKQFGHTYEDIISVENLLVAWREFVRGKRGRRDVQAFERNLMHNVLSLHHELALANYRHGPYEAFRVADPKPRHIHKASVRDRLVHHAVCRWLAPFFDTLFIADSYSCRLHKGTHKAVVRFQRFAGKVSQNNTNTAWVLKCDIRKYFASIDHAVLQALLAAYIPDMRVRLLLADIISSFSSTCVGVGIPLGNLTSQLFANVYLHELDRHVKHTLRARYYVRYADDFVLLSVDREELVRMLGQIERFLHQTLGLALHQDKVHIRTLASGVDFLGWIHFSHHRVLRTATKRRMLRRLACADSNDAVVQSYLGLLRHGNTYLLQERVEQLSCVCARVNLNR